MATAVSNTKLMQAINKNHLETITRLTILETSLADIPARVTALEHLKYQVLGGVAVLSTMISIAIDWFRKHA